MNKQKPNGQVDWLIRTLPNGAIDYGYTINPVSGCQHGCQWHMNGKVAVCYAKTMAERYGGKFEDVQFHPKRLLEPSNVKEGTSIFIDSNSDLMGSKVDTLWIMQVIEMMTNTPQHRYFLLTKNPGRLSMFNLPQNCWVGVSSPPDVMNGHELNGHQKYLYLEKALRVLTHIKSRGNITWMSFEPLSLDVSMWIEAFPNALSWAVIGAGSLGMMKVQPDKVHLSNLIAQLDANRIPVFMKSNMDNHKRQEFPDDNHR